MKKYFVYILKCNDDSYYTGVTNNVEKRVSEHQDGWIKECYTHDKRPILLVFQEEFRLVNQAIQREKQIKGWSRKKKEALIKGDYDQLPELSKNRQTKK